MPEHTPTEAYKGNVGRVCSDSYSCDTLGWRPTLSDAAGNALLTHFFNKTHPKVFNNFALELFFRGRKAMSNIPDAHKLKIDTF